MKSSLQMSSHYFQQLTHFRSVNGSWGYEEITVDQNHTTHSISLHNKNIQI